MAILNKHVLVSVLLTTLLVSVSQGVCSERVDETEDLLQELSVPDNSGLEDLVREASKMPTREGIASYYANRHVGKRTTSGQRYHPDKLTAAHHKLPLGTVVRVVNADTKQEVLVTVNDRCAPKPYPFIDLSRAAAQKIGLWGKGKLKVVIIPLLDKDPLVGV